MLVIVSLLFAILNIRKQKKNKKRLFEELDGAALMSESDSYGNIINVNDRF